MLRVLYLLNHAGKAGTERYVYSLMENLHNKNIKAYFAYNEYGLLVKRVEQLGVKTINVRMKKPWDLLAAKKIKKYCVENSIDIVHTHFQRENFIAMLSKALGSKVKVIYTNHIIMEKSTFMSLGNRLFSFLQDGVIAVCNEAKRMMIQNGISEQKIEVIFNGVDVNRLLSVESFDLEKTLGIKKADFTIFCASRFDEGKGHKFLIHSIKRLKDISNKDYNCILANDGPIMEDCKALVKELGIEDRVHFLGFREDVYNLMKACDIYVTPSKQEALSFANLEVLALGAVLIATKTGGNTDIINDDTDCGLLVEYDDVIGFSETMKALMDDDKLMQKLSENTKKVVCEKFSLEKMVENTYNLYERLRI